MTRKMILIAGVAGLALSPAVAQKPDRGGEQQKQERAERGGGDKQAQRAERPQRAERQQVQRAERPQRMERQMQRAERPQRMERQMQRAERPQRFERAHRVERQQQRAEGPERIERQQRVERPQRIERQVQRQERPQRIERQQQRIERQQQRIERQAQRPERVERQQQRFERQQQRIERQAQRPERVERQQMRLERQAVRQQQQVERTAKFDRNQRLERREMIREARQNARQDIRQDARQENRRENRRAQRFERRAAERLFAPIDRQVEYRTALFDGRGYRPLAPAFASRDMREMVPFRAKFDDSNFVSIGERYDDRYNWTPVPVVYGSRYFDNDDHYYRYNPDYGYAYQIDRQTNVIGGLYPLFGGYGIGDPWPQTYYSSYVPLGYRDYYYDTPDYYYRNDGYGIYQVDAGSQLITALVSLVLGQNYGVGQVLPASYSAYNVPLDYRDHYADSDDSWYRYGDGFIYEVEPYSRRVAARYPLYADDYYVGQRWPVAYPDYNVPYAYRDTYADTPQNHFRYANGGIYQVDPTNQLILALAALVSGDQFAVGQPMPAGYDIYNVPVDYRDRWADSDDEYYRYANGYVYRVDYGSGLIEEAFPVYA